MRALGRLIALPWLLVALAVQGLAPAQAQAMPRDAFGLPICSIQHQSDRHQDPARGQAHDCCGAACALAGLAGSPPTLASVSPAAFADPVDFRDQRRPDAVRSRLDRPPNARAPPASSTTI